MGNFTAILPVYKLVLRYSKYIVPQNWWIDSYPVMFSGCSSILEGNILATALINSAICYQTYLHTLNYIARVTMVGGQWRQHRKSVQLPSHERNALSGLQINSLDLAYNFTIGLRKTDYIILFDNCTWLFLFMVRSIS